MYIVEKATVRTVDQALNYFIWFWVAWWKKLPKMDDDKEQETVF